MPGESSGASPERTINPSPQHHTELLTLLSTDLVGSTQLKQMLGDAAAVRLIQAHREVVRELRAEYVGSEEIETAGDSFLIVFARPSQAVRFALGLQDKMRLLSGRSPVPLQLRIGIHLGEIVIEHHTDSPKAKDLYGAQVDICFRLTELARGGQVLLTRPVFDNARAALRGVEGEQGLQQLRWLSHGPYRFKGVEEPVEVCEVRREPDGPPTAPTGTAKAERIADERDIVLGWRPAVGQEIPGLDWVLEEKLGEGGFGEVWLAQHQHLGEERVFKFCFRADHVRSLKREVTLFRLLKERVGEHPNIVRIFDVYFERPPFYIAEEYVPCRDLRTWCEAQGGVDRIPLPIRLEIVAQAADALQAAHEAGIIHRDVKPGNILICQGSRSPDPGLPLGPEGAPLVKLTDFGIGQIVADEILGGQSRSGFTRTLLTRGPASLAGTQLYMAPELFAEKPASTRSDIYALGVVLFQLLVEDFRRPLTTEWPEAIDDPLLREDLKRCFAGNPSDRFAGAGQLATRLRSLPDRRRALTEQQALLAARESAAYRRGIVRTAAIGGVLVALIAALAWLAIANARAKLRQTAETRAATVSLAVGFGERPANRGDWLSAALWYAEAFSLEDRFRVARDMGFSARTHQFRIASILGQVPELEQMWFDCEFGLGGFDPAGRQVLLGSSRGYQLHRIDTGEPVGARVGQGDARAALSADGQSAFTGGGPGRTLTRWDLSTGTASPVRFLEPGTDQQFQGDLRHLVVSPDGRWVAAALRAPEGRVLVWEAATGQPRGAVDYSAAGLKWNPEADAILSMTLDGSGERLLTTDTGNRAVVWHWPTSAVAHVLGDEQEGHTSWVYGGAFAHEHTNWVVTCSFDRSACLWDLNNDKHPLRRVEHEDDGLQDVQFSPGDRTFVTAGLDSTVRLWDSATGRLVPSILRDHGRVTRVQWDPAGERLLTLSHDGVVRLWRFRREGSSLQVAAVDATDDGRFELSVREGAAQIRELTTGVLTVLSNLPVSSAAWSFAGNPDRLLSWAWEAGGQGADPGRLQLWSTLRQAAIGESLLWRSDWFLTNGQTRLAFSPQGEQVLFFGDVAESKPGILLWEPVPRSGVRPLVGDAWSQAYAAFDPQGAFIAVGGNRAGEDGSAYGTLRLLPVGSEGAPIQLLDKSKPLRQIIFSGDGTWLAAATAETELSACTAELWRRNRPGGSFEPAGSLEHFDGVLCVAFFPIADPPALATGCEDQAARVWHRTARGEWEVLARPLNCHGQVYACAVNHDGRWLATASRTPESHLSREWDSHLRIWDLTRNEPMGAPFVIHGKITRLVFSATDRFLLAERVVPPAAPQGWILPLETEPVGAAELLRRAQLLSGQQSFLDSARPGRADSVEHTLATQTALVNAANRGTARRLTQAQCRQLWKELRPQHPPSR